MSYCVHSLTNTSGSGRPCVQLPDPHEDTFPSALVPYPRTRPLIAPLGFSGPRLIVRRIMAMNHVKGEFQVKEKARVAEGSRSAQTSATRESIELCVPQTPLEQETKRKSISMVGITGSTLKLEQAANSAADCTPRLEPQPGLRSMRGHIASSAATEIVPVGSTISNDNISDDRNLKRLTSVSVHTVGSKRSSSSTYITARSIRSSVATFETATSGQRSINCESTLSRCNTILL